LAESDLLRLIADKFGILGIGRGRGRGVMVAVVLVAD